MQLAPKDSPSSDTSHDIDIRDSAAAETVTTPVLVPTPASKNETAEPAQPIKKRGAIATYYALARVKFEYLIREAAKFGLVGIFAMFIDVGLFNFFMYSGDFAIFAGKPLTAKVASVTIAMTFAYFANRFWTFRDRGRTSMVREYVMFVVLNGIGMGIALGCLWFSHYALGLTGALADNISANVIGLILGTIFRFWAYRKWVFPEAETEDTDELTEAELSN